MPEYFCISYPGCESGAPWTWLQTCIQVRRMIHFCTLHSLLQSASATFIPFVIIPLPSRHLSWPWLSVSFQTNTPGCFVTVSFNRLGRERARVWQGNRPCASMHSFYLTSLWCETAQYSAFPDQWRLNTLSWGPCSGMVEMQIIHAPEIKSFQYLLNPKEKIFFPFFAAAAGTQVPAWSDDRDDCKDPQCSSHICARRPRCTFKTLSLFTYL